MPRFEAKLLLKKEGLLGIPGLPVLEGDSRVEMAVGKTKDGSSLPLKPSLVYLFHIWLDHKVNKKRVQFLCIKRQQLTQYHYP